MSQLINEFVSLAPVGDALYLLVVEYEEADGGNGVGYINRTDGTRQTVLEGVLSTNDTLRSMWASPGGSLWAASEDGNVWTNAKVKWGKPRQTDIEFKSHDPSMKWSVTTLPQLRDEGYDPTLGPLWGTGDADVFVGAAGGHVYHWDGKAWLQVHTAAGDIRAFSGTGPADVYAVGEQATLLHFDGAAWTTMQPPPGGSADEAFTGCCIAPDGSLLVCSSKGRLLHGSHGGLAVLARDDDLYFMGIALLDTRVLLAGRGAGVIELQTNAFVVARSTFEAVSVIPGNSKLYFLDTRSEPTYIEYDPSDTERPWARIRF